jgi:hypothetical protein
MSHNPFFMLSSGKKLPRKTLIVTQFFKIYMFLNLRLYGTEFL